MKPYLLELRRQQGQRRQRLGWALLCGGALLLLVVLALLVHRRFAVGALHKELAQADAALARAASAWQSEMASQAAPLRSRLEDARPWLDAPWERALVALETIPLRQGHLQAAEINAATGQMQLRLTVAEVADGIEYAIRLGQRGGLAEVRVISHETVSRPQTTRTGLAGAGAPALPDAPALVQVIVQAQWTRALAEAAARRPARSDGSDASPGTQPSGGAR